VDVLLFMVQCGLMLVLFFLVTFATESIDDSLKKYIREVAASLPGNGSYSYSKRVFRSVLMWLTGRSIFGVFMLGYVAMGIWQWCTAAYYLGLPGQLIYLLFGCVTLLLLVDTKKNDATRVLMVLVPIGLALMLLHGIGYTVPAFTLHFP
jgi:hypothetical protein